MEPHHFHSMIACAVLEQKYNVAAKWFHRQIHVDQGYVPIEGRLGWDTNLELGLWAVAQHALREKNGGVQGMETRDVGQEEKEGRDGDADGMVGVKGEGLYVVQKVFDAVRNMCLMLPTDQERCEL